MSRTRIVVTHVASGQTWGFIDDCETIVTKTNINDILDSVASQIHQCPYIIIGTNILPGEFIRNQCVVAVQEE